MNIKGIHSVYFLGIGGIGMSAIARYFLAIDIPVFGYDKVPSSITDDLTLLGANIHFEDSVESIPSQVLNAKEGVLVILTPAIPQNHLEFNFLKEKGYIIKKRAEVLGLITADKPTIGVAGTHGKTTTSTMLAHLLKEIGVNVTAFLGGISTNYHSNLILSQSTDIYVVEADEFDRSFLKLNPETSIVTSIDADHLDIYGEHDYLKQSFNQYIQQTSSNIILNQAIIHELKLEDSKVNLSYSESIEADAMAQNVRIENGVYMFDYHSDFFEFAIKDLELQLPGRHNVSNMVAAISAALFYTKDVERIKNAVASFEGVKRRFEYHIKQNDLIFIDDYAHHPKEIESFLSGVNELYHGKRITAVFQPHLYSRTRDFLTEFAESLSVVDELILLDIYPARELPIDGVSSDSLMELVEIDDKKIMSKSELLEYSKNQRFEVFLTIGAGDVDRLITELKINLLGQKTIDYPKFNVTDI